MTKDYRERIDPGGEQQRLVEGMSLLTTGPFGWALRKLGIDEETLASARGLKDTYSGLMTNIERVAELLAPVGWIAFGAMPTDAYARAAALVEAGQPTAAEELLVEAWNDGDIMLRWAVNRVRNLYEGSEEREAIGFARFKLLDEAFENHKAERYASAISLVIEQLDGVVYDMTGENARSFFAAKRKAQHLQDEETLAGHPQGVTVLADLFNKDVKQTSLDGGLRRHGIIHGRELGYDTRANSTKVFVAMLAVIEWAEPIAKAKAARLRAEHERRYAGSDERDEFGRRLDRRGFKEAQDALRMVAMYQSGHFQRCRTYARTLLELDVSGGLAENAGLELEASADGRHFRAWMPTPTGVVFGVAGEDGEWAVWEFVGEEAPPGDLADGAWRHQARDEPHPDW